MKFLSDLSMVKQPKQRPPIHSFNQSTALDHLKQYSIIPDQGRFILIAERHYGHKTFDALDYLKEHGYEVIFI